MNRVPMTWFRTADGGQMKGWTRVASWQEASSSGT